LGFAWFPHPHPLWDFWVPLFWHFSWGGAPDSFFPIPVPFGWGQLGTHPVGGGVNLVNQIFGFFFRGPLSPGGQQYKNTTFRRVPWVLCFVAKPGCKKGLPPPPLFWGGFLFPILGPPPKGPIFFLENCTPFSFPPSPNGVRVHWGSTFFSCLNLGPCSPFQLLCLFNELGRKICFAGPFVGCFPPHINKYLHWPPVLFLNGLFSFSFCDSAGVFVLFFFFLFPGAASGFFWPFNSRNKPPFVGKPPRFRLVFFFWRGFVVSRLSFSVPTPMVQQIFALTCLKAGPGHLPGAVLFLGGLPTRLDGGALWVSTPGTFLATGWAHHLAPPMLSGSCFPLKFSPKGLFWCPVLFPGGFQR